MEFLVRWRYALGALALALCAFLAVGLQNYRLDTTADSMLSEGDPYKAEVDEVREMFPPSTSVIFVFETNPDLFTFDALRAIDDLTQRYTEVDSAIAIGSLMNRRLNAVDAERYDRDYLVPELDTLSEADLAAIRDIALADEDLTKSILSPAGDMSIAQLKYKNSEDDQATRLAIARSVLDLRDDLRARHPNVAIYALGGALFELEGYNAQIKDNQLLRPLIFGLAIVLLWFCLKSLLFALGLFSISLASVAMAIGTFGWLDIAFNGTSNLGSLVVLVVAIAGGIHVVAVYAQGLATGLSKLDAMRESLKINLQPVTLTSVTTAIGFLGLNYSSSPGIYGFGNIVAIGVGWAYLLTLLLLPAVILLLPVNRAPKPLGVRAFIVAVERLVANHGNRFFWGGAVLIVATLAMLPLNKLDFNRFSFVDEDSDFHYVITALAEKIGNDQSLVYAMRSGEYYGITDPAFLQQVDRFAQWVETHPEASFVTSYTDLLRTLNKSEHDDDPAYDALPTDKLQIIDYLVGYQLVQEIEPSLEPIFDVDYSSIRVVIGTANLSNREIVEFGERIDAWADANVDPKYRVLHGDNNILFARLNHSITMELVQGFGVTFALITLTLIVGSAQSALWADQHHAESVPGDDRLWFLGAVRG